LQGVFWISFSLQQADRLLPATASCLLLWGLKICLTKRRCIVACRAENHSGGSKIRDIFATQHYRLLEFARFAQ